MATELTKIQWIEILLDKNITYSFNIKLFQALYSFPEQKARASLIGLILGFSGKNTSSPLNSELGRYAKRIAKYYEIDFTIRSTRKYKYWDLFFNGWDDKQYFIWQLRPQLINALEETGLTGEEQFPEEIPNGEQIFFEGLTKTITINNFERNPKVREKCIDHWKAVCSVCSFDFEKQYGELGTGYIHVHHLVPLSSIKRKYQIDPINDLKPVCPNCHSMLHRTNPPLTIIELKEKIKQAWP